MNPFSYPQTVEEYEAVLSNMEGGERKINELLALVAINLMALRENNGVTEPKNALAFADVVEALVDLLLEEVRNEQLHNTPVGGVA